MSERCNNSACFSVEIKGTSDICVTFVVYACGKSILGVRTHEKDTADRRQRHLYMVPAKILTAPGLPGKNGLYAERSADRHPRGNAAGVCCDLDLPDGSGMDFLDEVRAADKELPFIWRPVMTRTTTNRSYAPGRDAVHGQNERTATTR